VASVYTGELDAGQTLTLATDIPLQGLPFKDKYKVSVVLDCNNTVFETDKSNNQKETYFSIAAPDLAVQAIGWSPEAPSTGGSITFNVIVKNIGDLKAGSTYLSYYIDKTFMGKHRIEDIEPGTTVTRSFTWIASKASFVFTAVIDEANQVLESDKSNNTKTVVIPAPDLIIDSLTWSPENPAEIIPVTFTASIRNRGYGRAAGTLLSVYFDGAAPLSLETGEISPGGTTTVVFTYSFAPGDHTIRLIADGNDSIAESNESNNEKTVKFSVQSKTRIITPPAAPSNNTTSVKQPVLASAVAPKTSENLTAPDKPVPDIAANITAPPPKWQSIIQSKWFIIGFGVVGVGAIGLLLFLRNKSKKS
jgi:subtilase family serine protease